MTIMEKKHPEFMQEAYKDAVINGRGDKTIGKHMAEGMEYWCITFSRTVGQICELEIPLVIAALRETADAYSAVMPEAEDLAKEIRENIKRITIVNRTPRK
jgi:hypothetical protein